MAGWQMKVRRLGGAAEEGLPGSVPHLGLDEIGVFGPGLLVYNDGQRTRPLKANNVVHWFAGWFTGEEDTVEVFSVDGLVANVTKDAPNGKLSVDMDIPLALDPQERFRLLRYKELFYDFDSALFYQIEKGVGISGGKLQYTFEFIRTDTGVRELPYERCPLVACVVQSNADPESGNGVQTWPFS